MLKQYEELVGKEYLEEVYELAEPLKYKSVIHINSTFYGGGVVEILNSLVILLNELGIESGWDQIKGSPEFFATTKMLHNALQGDEIDISRNRKGIYLKVNKHNSIFTQAIDYDCVIIHDPQPLPLIKCYAKRQPWIWRCHIDLSKRYGPVWDFLKEYINLYDAMIVTLDKYKQEINLPQYVIHPSIDPFNDKNRKLSQKEIEYYLTKYEISLDKPIISQISRFDRWKDPLGVVKAFKIIKKEFDCRLVLLGNMAQDDPEGEIIYHKLLNHVKDDEDITVSTKASSLLVNALQSESRVIIQKSIREGFALTVSEALWKGTPVVGGNVGGIPLQIIDGKTGYLVNNIEECAEKVVSLLKNQELAKKMGELGREHVRKNFLMIRHLKDYVNLLRERIINYKF